jgi:hypothetical protein
MRTFTVSQLIEKFRVRGGYGPSNRFTPAVIMELLESGFAELHDLLISKWGEDYFTKRATAVMTPATESYNLPADFLKLLAVDVSVGGRWRDVPRYQLTERNNFQSGALAGDGMSPYAHRLEGDSLLFAPIPLVADTYRLIYVRCAPLLTTLDQAVEGYNGWEELGVLYAVLTAKDGQDEPTQGIQKKLQRQIERVEWAADGRNAMPARIPDPDLIDMVGI